MVALQKQSNLWYKADKVVAHHRNLHHGVNILLLQFVCRES